MIKINLKFIKFLNLIQKIIGIIKVISTSKIKKIKAIKKNCKEKGKRAEFLGSNPHSNGEFFSRSLNVFLEKILANIITKLEIIIINLNKNNNVIIIYTKNN